MTSFCVFTPRRIISLFRRFVRTSDRTWLKLMLMLLGEGNVDYMEKAAMIAADQNSVHLNKTELP